MDYAYEITSIIQKIDDADVLAFYYGLIAELTLHLIETEQLTLSS